MSARGGCLPRGWGCLPKGVGVSAQGCLPRWGCLSGGGGICPGGVPCDLSHNVFDVTCMLRVNTYAAAYIVLVGHVTCDAC